MSVRLSYTSSSMYKDCGRKYKYHYLDKYREKGKSSALLFGGALDEGLNELLSGKGSGENAFTIAWIRAEINKEQVILETSNQVKYSQADFDADLLTSKDARALHMKAGVLLNDSSTEIKQLYNQCLSAKRDGIATEAQLQFMSICCWHSLFRKGILLLKEYNTQIMPRIEKVLEVQRDLKIENGTGDFIVGKVDLIATWENGKTYIFDNKTSSIIYASDSVKVSDQLGFYCWALESEYNTRNCGYIVIDKNVKKIRNKTCMTCGNTSDKTHKTCDVLLEGKRCNGEWSTEIDFKVKIDIILDEMPKEMDNKVLEDFNLVNHAIKSEVFEKNLNACKKPWGMCEFYNLCHKGDAKGLVKV